MTDAAGQVTADMRAGVDGRKLLSALNIDAEEIRRRKSFVRLTDADEERLEALEPMFDDAADDLAEDFYDHLGDHSDAMAFVGRTSKTLDILKADQATYLRELTRGEYDDDYFAKRARIGKIHDMIDLGPKYYLGAYVTHYEGLFRAIGEQAKAEFADGQAEGNDGVFGGLLGRVRPSGSNTENAVDEAVEYVIDHMLPVMKLLSLDQQVAMETYIHSYSEAARQEAARRRRLANEVESDLQAPIEEVLEQSQVITDRTDDIKDIAQTQADDMETVSMEVSDMSATVEEIAATAEEVERTSADAASRAAEGEDAADEAIDVMQDVSSSAERASDDVQRLHDQIEEIDEVLEAINDIAEQTNLLALNASIEAARAGEAGDGFAVVASEVKNLAEESQARAAEVEETVDNIQSEAKETIESLSQTTGRLHDGIDRGEDVMRSLTDISAAVEQASAGIGEVASATDEQAVSAEQIADMVDRANVHANDVSEQITDISDANRAQNDRVLGIRESVQRLGGNDDARATNAKRPVSSSPDAAREVTSEDYRDVPSDVTPSAEALENVSFDQLANDGGAETE
ncbi:globin-coupled sensor protein [Haloferax namakaokahaiae]|uniref:Globin-coupled sensor protein n=1 Tax=Haloferax namakaokahaiae TaxID=1748331 RepID=A0ABD5ZFA0_9EURY